MTKIKINANLSCGSEWVGTPSGKRRKTHIQRKERRLTMSEERMAGGSVVPIHSLRKWRNIQRRLDEQITLGFQSPGKGKSLDELQAFVEEKRLVPAEASESGFKPPSLRQAGRILGKGKLIGLNQACRVWNLPKLEAMPAIRYREETLVEAARQNQQQDTDWRLIYCHGMSLRRQREIRGIDQKKQPCFWEDKSTWWLESKEDNWANQIQLAGYYLLDFQPRWPGINWNAQQTELEKLGENYERCCPHIFSEAIFTIFMVTRQRIAENWYHWSAVMDADRRRVDASHLSADGLHVGSSCPANATSFLRVCVLRKFDA